MRVCTVCFNHEAERLQSVAAEALRDIVVNDTPIFLRSSTANNGSLSTSYVLNNIQLQNVSTAIAVSDGAIVLNGTTGAMTIDSWGQGNVYSSVNGDGRYTQGNLSSLSLPSALLDAQGRVVSRTHPQYADYSVSQFFSVKDYGAIGDGITDDTDALQLILNTVHSFSSSSLSKTAFTQYANCKIIFFDAGTYIVTSTLTIPANSRIVGEAWTEIQGRGSFFEDVDNPQVVVRVGPPGSQGIAEITDIVFTTSGPG